MTWHGEVQLMSCMMKSVQTYVNNANKLCRFRPNASFMVLYFECENKRAEEKQNYRWKIDTELCANTESKNKWLINQSIFAFQTNQGKNRWILEFYVRKCCVSPVIANWSEKRERERDSLVLLTLFHSIFYFKWRVQLCIWKLLFSNLHMQVAHTQRER